MIVRYALVQYRHTNDERLNLGMIVHDPVKNTALLISDVPQALERAAALWPDFPANQDRVWSLTMTSLPREATEHADEGGLEWVRDHHTLGIRLSGVRVAQGESLSSIANSIARGVLLPPEGQSRRWARYSAEFKRVASNE